MICCEGRSGHNAEYVLKLAEWIKSEVPECFDDHLFTLATLVKAKIADKNLSLASIVNSQVIKLFQY